MDIQCGILTFSFSKFYFLTKITHEQLTIKGKLFQSYGYYTEVNQFPIDEYLVYIFTLMKCCSMHPCHIYWHSFQFSLEQILEFLN